MNTAANANITPFLQYDDGNKLNIKKTLRAFSEHLQSMISTQERLKPVILAELREHGKLGEGTLINFTIHSLKLTNNTESVNQVKEVLNDLAIAGTIKYLTNESGTKKGRSTGWVLANT